jgi:hypothetical protein
MKGREIQKVNSFLSLALICRENIAIIAIMPAMLVNVKLLDQLLLELFASIEDQAKPITHFAKEKMRLRKDLAFLLSDISGIFRSYVLSIDEGWLKKDFPYGYSELFRMSGMDLISHGLNLITFLNDNFDCFRNFGFKKDKFDKLKTLHKKFCDVSPKPHVNRCYRKTQTKLMPERISKIESLIKEQMEPLLSGFTEFPEFCKTFKSARKQIKHGRPKEVLKNKIKKYRSAPALPKTRKSSKHFMQVKPLVMTENFLPENIQESNSGS